MTAENRSALGTDEGGGSNAGALIGVVVGCLVVGGIVAAYLVCFRNRNQTQATRQHKVHTVHAVGRGNGGFPGTECTFDSISAASAAVPAVNPFFDDDADHKGSDMYEPNYGRRG